MKLIGNLKSKVDKAQNKEDAKRFISEAGMELTANELEMVTGGCQHMVVPLDNTIPGGSQIQNPVF